MKKIIYFLMLLPLCLFSSCKDDKDLPDVDLYLSLDNVVVENNVIYAVKNEAIRITDVSVKGVGSNAILTSVTYFWDGLRKGESYASPFQATVPVGLQTVGNHSLGINAEVAQVDKEFGFITASYHVVVVDSTSDLPDGASLGTATIVILSESN